jgi:hypothetical protein
MNVVFYHIGDFLDWGFRWFIIILFCSIYYHCMGLTFREEMQVPNKPVWRLYANALKIGVGAATFIWVFFIGANDLQYGLKSIMIAVVLSICAVYHRQSPPIRGVYDVLQEPKTYIGIVIGLLVATYYHNHDLQYVSWEEFLNCYDERKNISSDIKIYENKKDSFYKNDNMRGTVIEKGLDEIIETRNKINNRGKKWMDKCFNIKFSFQSDNFIQGNGMMNNTWEYDEIE